jgi:hypothetical protein
MWANSRIASSHHCKRRSLLQIFRLFTSDAQQQAGDDDDSADAVWKSISPAGNIYRLNAYEAEHLRHQEDLQGQMQIVANQLSAVLDSSESVPGEPDDVTSLEDHAQRNYMRMLHQLRKAPVKDDVASGGDGIAAATSPYKPLLEFLGPSSVSRSCLGLILMPLAAKPREHMLKNRFVAILIFVIQVFGPLFIFVDCLYDDSVKKLTDMGALNVLKTYFTISEALCLGSFQESVVTLMGSFFLLLFIDIVRTYASSEKVNYQKTINMPYDRFWFLLGQFANAWCILWAVMALPILFATEKDAKDIIFDSLGMLFMFTLDDLAGDALGYLDMDDETFQRINGWTFAILGQCPVRILDVVNLGAKNAEDIWQIRLGPKGLLQFGTESVCRTRLQEPPPRTPTDKDRLLANIEAPSPLGEDGFEYCVYHNAAPGNKPLISSLPRFGTGGSWIWFLFGWLLFVLECIFPLSFFIINNPCTVARDKV